MSCPASPLARPFVTAFDAWDDDFRASYTRYCADRAHELARENGIERWAEVIEPSIPEGPALLSFLAARIAEEDRVVVIWCQAFSAPFGSAQLRQT